MLDNPGTSVTPPYGRSRSRSFPAALKNPTSPETSRDMCFSVHCIARSASSENAQTSALGDSVASRFVANTAFAVSNAQTLRRQRVRRAHARTVDGECALHFFRL